MAVVLGRAVAQPGLDQAQVDAGFQQVGRIRVAQCVHAGRFLDAAGGQRRSKGPLHAALTDGSGGRLPWADRPAVRRGTATAGGDGWPSSGATSPKPTAAAAHSDPSGPWPAAHGSSCGRYPCPAPAGARPHSGAGRRRRWWSGRRGRWGAADNSRICWTSSRLRTVGSFFSWAGRTSSSSGHSRRRV